VFNNITKEKKSMKKRNRLISALLTATMLVGCLTMVGCGSQSGDSATGTQAEGASSMTSVTIGALYDPETMTPWSARNLGRIATCFNVYETMAEKADNDDGIVGILAKEWEKTDDYTYSVTLYDYITDSAGNDLKASDVEFSYTTAMAGGNFPKLADLESVTATGDYTVEFKFKNKPKKGSFATIMTEIYVATQAAYEADADQMATKPVGTGPYIMTDWVAGSTMTLEAREDYWQTDESLRANAQKQNIPEIKYQFISDTTQLAMAMQSGEVDASAYVSALDRVQFEGSDDWTVYENPQSIVYAMQFNCSDNSECQNENLRKAIAYSFDSQDFLDNAADGVGELVYGFGSAYSVDYYGDDYKAEGYFEKDQDLAKEYLQKYYDETGASSVTLTVLATTDSVLSSMAEILAGNLKEVGIETELNIVDQTTAFALYTDSTSFDINLGTEGSSTFLVNHLWNEFDASQYPEWDGDYMFRVDDKLQSLYEEASDETTWSKETVEAFQEYVNEKCYAIGCFRTSDFDVYRSGISEIVTDSTAMLVPGAFTYN
jgi:ABC-type transport system substrate-binding protein